MADGGPEIAPEIAPETGPGGWTGPLDLLLEEARRRRVDLARIPLAALVDACLARLAGIPSTAEKADQLVLAATLAEMKARFLLPPAEGGGEDEEARLRRHLEDLTAIRALAKGLAARPRLGRDVFARGAPETDPPPARAVDGVDLVDLVAAYARLRINAEAEAPFEARRALAMTLREALALLGARLDDMEEWTKLFGLIAAPGKTDRSRSVAAAGFAAALEMARRGEVEIRQDEAFGEVRIRRR